MSENDGPALKLGDDQFENMMLFLKTPINQQNHLDYKFGESELRELQEGIWAMPAYLQDDDPYSLFFLFTTIDSGEMVVAFAEGTRQDKQLKLGQPLTTGAGLNNLFAQQEKRAQRVLKFLNDISRADEAEWHQIVS
ncbi:hypothetical protein HC026_09105 [Lactobacillus sp. LC28-10]|uniref:Uncharacterized protein n=1 Tax=Secundilactobacillus angelensis TaxID=2722706 RepID=A0ABX1KYQ6_9LACO|nr:hypothetical protein [Secundilactobacillus angelensis]MCH5462779.1 hypothetical protein [Secundilactobacillus angelensis]NLR19067.1 hypothetical protein [Secundilactobacillus angelensis]